MQMPYLVLASTQVHPTSDADAMGFIRTHYEAWQGSERPKVRNIYIGKIMILVNMRA